MFEWIIVKLLSVYLFQKTAFPKAILVNNVLIKHVLEVPVAYLRYRAANAGLTFVIEHVTVSANEASVTVRT